MLTPPTCSQSITPSTLPSVLGDSLTPDLASAIVKALASYSHEGKDDESWKIDFLRGLTKVRRFGMAAGFLDVDERKGEQTWPLTARAVAERVRGNRIGH